MCHTYIHHIYCSTLRPSYERPCTHIVDRCVQACRPTLQAPVSSSKSWHAVVMFSLVPVLSVSVTWYVCISLTSRVSPTNSVHANIEAALMLQVVFTQSSFDFRVKPSTIAPMHAAEHTHAIDAASRNSRLTAFRAPCGRPSG